MGKAAVSGFWPSLREREVALPPVTAVPTTLSEIPATTRAVEAIQASTPRLGVFAVDGVIVVAAAIAAGATATVAAAAAAAFVLVGWLTNLYAERSTVDAQGVSWYLRHLPYALLAVASALVLAGHRGTALLAPVAGAALALIVVRSMAWVLLASHRRRHEGLREALLVGAPDRTQAIARRIDAFPEAGLRVAARYSPANTNGERSRARALLRSGAIRHILIAADAHDEALLEECLAWSGSSPVDVHLALPVGARSGHVSGIGDLSVVSIRRARATRRLHWGKRLVDILGSAALILFLAPVFLLVSAAIYIYDGRPVIYRQRRVGLNNREFTIWKFRSMVGGADQLTDRYADANMASGLLFKLPDDPRVTPIGNLIRRLGVDELPQLFNVLMGDMSLVGPRPLPVDPDEFDAVASKRHRVRPGITGPWQVAGGHTVGYEDMIKLDLAYVDTWSIKRDLWLLLMTIPTVVVRRSAY